MRCPRLTLDFGLWNWTLELDFGIGFWNWTLKLDFGLGLRTWTLDLDCEKCHLFCGSVFA